MKMSISEKKRISIFPIVFLLIFIITGPGQGAENSAQGRAALRLSLEEAVSLALQSNRNLIAVANTVSGDRLSIDGARSDFDLKFNPSANIGAADSDELLGAGMMFEKEFYSGIRMQVEPSISRSNESSTGLVDMSVQIPLLKGWGKTVNKDAINQSAYSLRTSERSLHLARVDTVIQTITIIYRIIEKKEIIRLLEDQVRVMEAHAETARIKRTAELATTMDVYRALIRLKDIQDSLSALKSSLTENKNALKRLLALPLDQPLDVMASFNYKPVSIGLYKAIEAALKSRTEIIQANDAVGEARRRAMVAEHNLKPQLDLVLDYERLDEDYDIDFSVDDLEERWQVNLVSSTDWARTREKIRYRQCMLDVENAELRLRAQKDRIISEVRNQFEILENWKTRIQIKKEQIQQAMGKKRLSQIKFKNSMADNFDLIEAESELFRAKTDLISVKVEYIVNQYRLQAVMERLLDRDGELNFVL